jgi:hypothetical protein
MELNPMAIERLFSWMGRPSKSRSATAVRRRRKRIFRVESLEDRRLLAADFYVNDDWNLVTDNGVIGTIDAGDIVDDSNDPGGPTITATYGTDAFGVVTTGTVTGSDLSYDEIQDAINSAAATNTIELLDGSYSEDLTIDEQLTIRGVGTASLNGAHTITSSNVTLSNLTFNVSTNEVGVGIDASGGPLDNILIEDSIFNLDSPTVAIDVGVGAGNSKISNVTIEDNVFNGPVDMISNPMRIGSGFGSQDDVEIDGLTFQRNAVDSGSIPVYLFNQNISNVLVTQNTFTNTDGTFYVWANSGEASTSTGQLLNFEYSENSVDSTNSYGIGFDVLDGLDDDNFDLANPPVVSGNSFDVPGAYGIGAVSIACGHR